jgi:hypothetical protein
MVIKKPCPTCAELVRVEARRCQFCMTTIAHGAPLRWRAAVFACAVVISAAAGVLAVVG